MPSSSHSKVNSPSPVVEEGGDVYNHLPLVLDGGDVGDLDGVFDLIQVESLEVMVVLVRSVCTVSDVCACRGDRIAEAPVVGVSDIENRLLVEHELWELVVFPPDQW